MKMEKRRKSPNLNTAIDRIRLARNPATDYVDSGNRQIFGPAWSGLEKCLFQEDIFYTLSLFLIYNKWFLRKLTEADTPNKETSNDWDSAFLVSQAKLETSKVLSSVITCNCLSWMSLWPVVTSTFTEQPVGGLLNLFYRSRPRKLS